MNYAVYVLIMLIVLVVALLLQMKGIDDHKIILPILLLAVVNKKIVKQKTVEECLKIMKFVNNQEIIYVI